MSLPTPPPSIEPWLLDILRCPVGMHPMTPTTDDVGDPVLVCSEDCPEPGSRRQYPIEDGIPVMLRDSAVVVPAPRP